MSEVVVDNPRRARNGGSVAREDFPDVPGCVDVRWGAGGALVVEFDRDLSAAEVETVRTRCVSTGPEDEQQRTQARKALRANRDFLALTNPTQAQALAQVQLLTREVTALARIVLQDHEED